MRNLDVTLLDGPSLFGAAEAIAERSGSGRLTLDYQVLYDKLSQFRADKNWRPASLYSVLLAIDPKSDGQKRFATMLRHAGYETNEIDFREVFVSSPPGHSLSEGSNKSLTSMASRISYVTGLMARRNAPHYLVVTHAFEVCDPLLDLSQRIPESQIGIAYFGSLLDYRWKAHGIVDGDSLISF
ncbi:MAG: hypothetical protein R3C02_08370 [Planctomycetaceae bacterium]